MTGEKVTKQLSYFLVCALVCIFNLGCSPLENRSLSETIVATQKKSPPNVIIILTDDQGYADTSKFGQTKFATPNIDSIADNGAMLTQFYVSQPICSTSRASLLTGAYANRIGVSYALMPSELTDGPVVGLHPDEETLAEILKAQGYATGLFGKWHLGDQSPFLPTEQGFDQFYGIPYSNDMWSANKNPHYAFSALPVYSQTEVVKTLTNDQSELTKELTQKSINFIKDNADSPFFLMLAHPQPHVPLFVSKEFEGKSGVGLYGDVIMEIDWSTGQILDALKSSGVYDNTLVIFLSDNGPWLTYGNHAGSAGTFRNGKQSNFEGGVRTPTHIQWPAGLPKQAPIHTPMMTIDLLPTIAKLTGASLPKKEIDGKDIWPILTGQQTTPAHEAYFFYFHHNDLSAVRYQQWKLYFPHRYNSVEKSGVDGVRGLDRFVKLDEIKLYDLEKDPSEVNDVSKKRPDIVALIDSIADKKRQELGDNLRNVVGAENRPLGGKTVIESNFSKLALGKINDKQLLEAYPKMKWAQPYDRVQVLEHEGNNVLGVDYPKGSVGPQEGGAQWVWQLPPRNEYLLTYSVQFEPNFDFRLGGKLPGLTSGGEKWTGGNRPLLGEGWSARLMWREQGMAELYLYYLDMKGKWGDSIPLASLKFVPGKWYNIRQRIKVNTPGQNDARIQLWVNNELKLDMQDFRLRISETGNIDSLYFSTFHGGNQPKWGPHRDSRALFGDFQVYW